MKASKLVLEYDYDFILIGLVSAAREFKLAWQINEYLKIGLKKEVDLEYDFLKGYKIFISNFIFETEYSSFRLLKNRSVEFLNVQKPFLLPELKNYDYFAMLDGDFAYHAAENLSLLKEVPAIQLIKPINVETLPSKENLLIK